MQKQNRSNRLNNHNNSNKNKIKKKTLEILWTSTRAPQSVQKGKNHTLTTTQVIFVHGPKQRFVLTVKNEVNGSDLYFNNLFGD